jgi:cytochrome P450
MTLRRNGVEISVSGRASAIESLRATADSEPYAFYDRLRANGPLTWDAEMNAWLNSTYAGCKFVARNEEVLFRHAYLDMGAETFIELEGGPRNILFLKADDHRALHRWFLRVLSPNRAEAWRASLVRPVFDLLVDSFCESGRVELFKGLADRFPVRVIAALMGLDWRDDELVDFCKHQMEEISLFLEAHGVDDPEITRRALEEMLRLYGAIHFRPRIANQDIEIAGCPVGKDETILNVNLAANRDPARYERPHEVVLDRPVPRDHFAFHHGPRICVGMALARVELQEAVRIFLERLPDARLDTAAEAPVFRGFLMRSFRPLHAVFTPTARMGERP